MKNLWIISADKKEIPLIDVFLKENKYTDFQIDHHTCGVGLFESYFQFMNLLNTCIPPDVVCLAGSAGSPYAADIFKTTLSNQFINPQFNFEELPEFLPAQWTTGIIESPVFSNDLLNVPVYSTFGISNSNDHIKDSMAGAWENMEALSLSYICMKKQIPFMALLCCTNQICPEGRKQWKQNYEKAGLILIDQLKKVFKNINV